jgi:unsaturated rhamnogalacturonyl hydrolase
MRLIIILFLLASNEFFNQAEEGKRGDIFTKKFIGEIMERVNSYQLANPWSEDDYNWIRGTYYTGVMACYQATGNKKYLIQSNTWGEKYMWGIPSIPDDASESGANLMTCSQTWLESYMVDNKDYKIKPAIEHLEMPGIKNPANSPRSYYFEDGRRYVDALFVCPPAFAMLSKITKDHKYLEWMDSFFWDVYGNLYDVKDHLFYRDFRFKPEFEGTGQQPVIPTYIKYEDSRESYAYQKTKNGKKVFWSRGNGWAFAGIARILKYLPEEYGNYNKYKEVFSEMAAELKKRQQSDGFWYPNLDDPEDYGSKESSGTSFFTYGLAWGINNGILSSEEYSPVVEKAWTGLVSVVSTEGKVQWGQHVGFSPHKILEEDSHEFVAGMFLLAASEIYKLKDNGQFSKVNSL